jgi:hydroxymethylglutaryl-CoA synthase
MPAVSPRSPTRWPRPPASPTAVAIRSTPSAAIRAPPTRCSCWRRRWKKAKPGDRIMVVGFGQGADALLFEVTDAHQDLPSSGLGVSGHLARRKEETLYSRFLAFNDTDRARARHALRDRQADGAVGVWRNHKTVTRFNGGKCAKCGTLQFPKTRICVNPNCTAIDTQEYPFAGRDQGQDQFLHRRPPHLFARSAGLLRHDPVRGGRPLDDGLHRRRREGSRRRPSHAHDVPHQGHRQTRGFRRYFWKAAPMPATRRA